MEANEEVLPDCKKYGHSPTTWDHTTTCMVCDTPLNVTWNGNGVLRVTEQAQIGKDSTQKLLELQNELAALLILVKQQQMELIAIKVAVLALSQGK